MSSAMIIIKTYIKGKKGLLFVFLFGHVNSNKLKFKAFLIKASKHSHGGSGDWASVNF